MKNLTRKQLGIAFFTFCVVGGFVLLVKLFQAPDFPESVPSSEQSTFQTKNRDAQLAFFHRYSRYLRNNHGGILEVEEISDDETDLNKKGFCQLRFSLRYTFLNKRLVLRLTDRFAGQEKIRFKVKKQSVELLPTRQTEFDEIEFLDKDSPWVSIRMGVVKEYSARSRGQIQFTEKTTVTEIDHEEDLGTTDNSRNGTLLVIIIDDLGNSMSAFNKLIELDFDITYSILPQQPYSIETAERVTRAGHDVMLHQPMQPQKWPQYDPGIGALMLADDQETIFKKLKLNLTTVPYAIGINNHMGSAFTQYESGLNSVMKILVERGLFFLDSKTAPGDTCKRSARNYGVTYLSRNIFLDNIQSDYDTKKQLYKAVNIATKLGRAIAIGHPYLTTYQTLATELPKLDARGIQIVGVSKLLR